MFRLAHTGNDTNDIRQYINKCKEKSGHHRKQARNSKEWDNILGLLTFILTSAQVLAMVIQMTNDLSNVVITITGSVFGFFIGLSSQVRNLYSFLALSYQHHYIADEYDELLYNLNILYSKTTDNETYTAAEIKTEFEKYIQRYVSVEQKNHIQSVVKCSVPCCCFRDT